jgi:hypothetical protein
VSLGLPWWINFAVDVLVIIGVLAYESRAIKRSSKSVELAESPGQIAEVMLPTSVRLAKFEPVKVEKKVASSN